MSFKLHAVSHARLSGIFLLQDLSARCTDEQTGDDKFSMHLPDK